MKFSGRHGDLMSERQTQLRQDRRTSEPLSTQCRDRWLHLGTLYRNGLNEGKSFTGDNFKTDLNRKVWDILPCAWNMSSRWDR